MAHPRDVSRFNRGHMDKPIGELFSEVGKDLGLLVRQEIQLARTELSAKLARLGKDALAIAIGGIVAYTGVLAVVAALILGLIQLDVTPWLAALITGLACIMGGFLVLRRGRRDLARGDLAPQRTVQAAKETVQWAKEQL